MTEIPAGWPPQWKAIYREDPALKAEMRLAETLVGLSHALRHHLDSRDDPCQDRGASWPCDVAEALRKYAGADVVER